MGGSWKVMEVVVNIGNGRAVWLGKGEEGKQL